jgi:hypothetical protein
MRDVKSLGCLVLSLCSVLSAGGAPEQAELARLYKRALAGDKQAVESCIAGLETAVQAQPQNQLARVYLGSAYTLRSRDMGFGPAKLATLKQGVATMDEAVAAAPDEPHVRLVRALTTDSLPFFLGRKKSSRDDFDWLGKTAAQSPQRFSEADLAVIRQHTEAHLDTSPPPR